MINRPSDNDCFMKAASVGYGFVLFIFSTLILIFTLTDNGAETKKKASTCVCAESKPQEKVQPVEVTR